MKVILTVAVLAFAIMGYALCRISGDISRLEEERDRLMAMNKSEYLCNKYCPFHHRANGKDYCKLNGELCDYKGEDNGEDRSN